MAQEKKNLLALQIETIKPKILHIKILKLESQVHFFFVVASDPIIHFSLDLGPFY